MSNSTELILLNRQTEIARLHDELESLGREHKVPPKLVHEVQLAVEEHLTNVIRYGFTDEQEHEIKARLWLEGNDLFLELVDDGRPFNPLDHPTPDLSLPLDLRPIGGVGIHMIRQSVDRLEYRRTEGRNILTMVKRIKVPAP